MAKRSLILTSTSNQGKKLQKTITDINPSADGNALKSFAQKLNAMTTNTYVQTDCIDKFNVDTEIPPIDTRQTPTLSFTPPTLEQVRTGTQATAIVYNGDGKVYVRRESGCDYVTFSYYYFPTMDRYDLKFFASGTVTGGTFIIGATGTENYKPIEVEYTLE